jgi:hypothetical protein
VARFALAFIVIAYSISLTFFEIRQCWIPQSREAGAILAAAETARPFRPGDVLVFAHAPHAMGTAPAFIAGASWSMNSMLQHYSDGVSVQGAREILATEQGELALYRRDSLAPFSRAELAKVRVFVRDESGRYASRSLLALPAGGGRFQLFAMRPGIGYPQQPLTMNELSQLSVFGEIYFAHPYSGPLPTRPEAHRAHSFE